MAYDLTPFDTGEACTVAIDEAFSFHDPDTAVACAHTLRAFLVGMRGAPTKLVLAGAAINRTLLAELQPDWIFDPSQLGHQALRIFTQAACQTGDIVPRPPVVPLVEEIFRRYSFTGTVRKCRKELAGIQCDKFKGYHYISAVIPKDAGSNTFVLRDDATGELVGFNAYGSHVGKTAADDKRKFLHSKRLVIFPWWQGMGLGPLLSECVASYAINGGKFRYGSVTANAGLAAHRDRSALWKANKGSGKLSKPGGAFNVEGHEGRKPTSSTATSTWGARSRLHRHPHPHQQRHRKRAPPVAVRLLARAPTPTPRSSPSTESFHTGRQPRWQPRRQPRRSSTGGRRRSVRSAACGTQNISDAHHLAWNTGTSLSRESVSA